MNPTFAAGAPVTRVRASRAQESRWRGSAFDTVNRVYRLRGPLEPGPLGEALAVVIGRHEALRCSLHHEGDLMMWIHPEVPTPLRHVAAPGSTPAEREAWLSSWLAEEVRRPFDRGEAPLLRVTLVRLDEADHVLVIVVDHIISDGWSVEVLVRELSAAYRAAIGEETEPPAAAGQYPEWVARQRAAFSEELLAARADFWRDRFPGGPQDVAVWLSGYRAPEEAPSGRAGVIEAVLDDEITGALRRAARRLRVTLNVLTATVLVRQLQKDTGQERIALSTSSASRFGPETASMIGYLASTIWVPTTLGGAEDLPAAMRAFHRDMLDAIAKSDVPARAVFERLWGRDARALMDQVPQVGFLCTPFWGESLVLPGVDVEASEIDDGCADAALSMYLTDRGSRIEVQARYEPETLEDGYPRSRLDDYVAGLVEVAGRFG
ncbi:condensation domain-containing protein [Microbispora sp. NPDC046933]|uniref:condensation domain-containing protein n=1 Tax=Microbispora sp. NPDC046933 TaxID=3155618 RepID=UPI0033F4F681